MSHPTQMLTARYEDWMALKTNLLWIYEGPVPTGGRGRAVDFEGIGGVERTSTLVALDYCALWLILKGEAKVSYENKTIRARAGHWLIPWQGIRDQEFTADAELLSVRFQAHWPDGRSLFTQGLGLVCPRERFSGLEVAARTLLARVKPFQPKGDPRLLGAADFLLRDFIQIKGALLDFVWHFYDALVGCGLQPSRLGTRDERVLAALSHLDRMPLTTKVRESDLAAEVGLGLSQFVRIFRTEVGVSPKKYLESRRLDTCRRMLLNSSIPLKQMADDLGFLYAPDFSAWFKKIHGVSPRKYRNARLRNDQV